MRDPIKHDENKSILHRYAVHVRTELYLTDFLQFTHSPTKWVGKKVRIINFFAVFDS